MDADWAPPDTSTRTSPDGRWFVTLDTNHVVLVDLEYKHRPDEMADRISKARFAPVWHQEQAELAATGANWYAAVFHYSLLLQNDAEQSAYYDGLQAAYQELQILFEQEELDLESRLPKVIKESLALPRGSHSLP